MLAGGVMKGNPTDTQVRQLWRDLTAEEREKMTAKITGDKENATSNTRGKVPGSPT